MTRYGLSATAQHRVAKVPGIEALNMCTATRRRSEFKVVADGVDTGAQRQLMRAAQRQSWVGRRGAASFQQSFRPLSMAVPEFNSVQQVISRATAQLVDFLFAFVLSQVSIESITHCP
ncbi:MAG: hypothetical protein ABL908_11695 [Hyphomicrobium sp.]